jgi:agmatine deiminase
MDRETVSEKNATGEQLYLMPAEWERHDGTWLSWPKDPVTFPPEIIGDVEKTYVRMVDGLAKGELVHILVDDEKMRERVSGMIGEKRPNVVFDLIKTVDVWMRDYGPIFVRSEDGLTATKWRFNAWGDKYEELKADNFAGLQVARKAAYRVIEPDLVLEGGSIDSNGRGTVLTTEQCLLNKNRNPDRTKGEIEGMLGRYLGFANFVWLKEGIVGDDTDGHIDDIARFVDASTVVCMVEKDRSDANYDALKKNLTVLQSAKDQDGKTLKVIPVDMPKKKVGGEDDRLPASYANFYVGNSVVLVPTFDDVNDGNALATLRSLFKGKEVIGINCEALVYGFGGIHCVTQQQPALGHRAGAAR